VSRVLHDDVGAGTELDVDGTTIVQTSAGRLDGEPQHIERTWPDQVAGSGDCGIVDDHRVSVNGSDDQNVSAR